VISPGFNAIYTVVKTHEAARQMPAWWLWRVEALGPSESHLEGISHAHIHSPTVTNRDEKLDPLLI